MAIEEICNICGATSLEPWKRRADGVVVLHCARCGMGVVERMPPDIEELYRTDYYASSEHDRGYADYELVAYHSTAWAASLAQLLCPSGDVLDIGCADGRLLANMKGPYRRHGIEMNPDMAQRCEEMDIRIIANDIYEPAVERFNSTFDVVMAVAVLEHVRDFKEAARRALAMTAPTGLFIFEVPLLSEQPEDEVWLRTSLEHIYYPCEASLQRLFEEEFSFGLIGARITIQDYGSTYIGIVAKNPDRLAEAEDLFRRVALGPVEAITSHPEIVCRLLLSVVHAATTAPPYLERLGLLFAERETPDARLLERLHSLWLRDRRRLESTTQYLAEVEQARDYHAERYRAAAAEGEPCRHADDEQERQ